MRGGPSTPCNNFQGKFYVLENQFGTTAAPISTFLRYAVALFKALAVRDPHERAHL